MPIPIQCPHCGAQHQVPDQMAGKRAKCRCGNAIAIPMPAGPAGMQPGQTPMRPTPQRPQQPMHGQPTASQPMRGAPMQSMPISADSAFAGLADEEMDDLFGPVGGPATQQVKAKPAEPEKKIPKNLVGAGDSDEDKAKKKNEGPVKLTPGEKALAIQGIVVGVAGEIAGAFVLYYFYRAFAGMQTMSQQATDTMATYRVLLPLISSIVALLATTAVMSIAGALSWAGFSAFKGRAADIGWTKKVGIMTATTFVLAATFYHLGLTHVAIGEKDSRFMIFKFQDEVVTQEEMEGEELKRSIEAAPEGLKESYRIDVIFNDVMYYLLMVLLMSIVPIYCAALSSYVKVTEKVVVDEFAP